MDQTEQRLPLRRRIGIVALIALIHVVVIAGLLRALAPDFSARAVNEVLSTFTVTITAPPPKPPEPAPTPQPSREQGAAAPAGRKAKPAPAAAPPARIPVPRPPMPRASSSGIAATAGAAASGAGTGAGGTGSGTGSGNVGSGSAGSGEGGGGAINQAQKIAGEINSARDYPRAGRDARIGDFVIVAMTVGTDGRASNCHVIRQSRDPQAGAITCRLVEARFRFRPASDNQGRPVTSVYGWRQRWFL